MLTGEVYLLSAPEALSIAHPIPPPAMIFPQGCPGNAGVVEVGRHLISRLDASQPNVVFRFLDQDASGCVLDNPKTNRLTIQTAIRAGRIGVNYYLLASTLNDRSAARDRQSQDDERAHGAPPMGHHLTTTRTSGRRQRLDGTRRRAVRIRKAPLNDIGIIGHGVPITGAERRDRQGVLCHA